MDDDSKQDEQDITANESTLDTNVAEENKNVANENEFPDNTTIILPFQKESAPPEAKHNNGPSPSPVRRQKIPQVVWYAVVLLIGIVLGAAGMVLFQLLIGGTRPPIANTLTPVASGNVTVHADQSIIAPLLENSVQSVDLPANGSINNVQIQFTNGTQMNISGNYQVSVLGVPVTQPFTLDAQLIVDNCQVQIQILQANISNISVTNLAALFEDKINQKLAQLIPKSNLAGNIEFCLINIATDEQGIIATFNLVLPPSSTPAALISKPSTML